MKRIPLTQGKFALVDDWWFEFLNQWKWSYQKVLSKSKEFEYAIRTVQAGKKISRVYMHREVLNTPKGMETDHINGNGLDNRTENLRICTTSQNQSNRHAVTGTSKFTGVSWSEAAKKWKGGIKKNYKQIHLGYFDSEEEAAQAYNQAAIEVFGEFSRLNEI